MAPAAQGTVTVTGGSLVSHLTATISFTDGFAGFGVPFNAAAMKSTDGPWNDSCW